MGPALVPTMEQYDTIELRNRDVTETLSNVSDFGCNDKYDKLDLRNRTVTETLSPLENLGQDKKEEVTSNGVNGGATDAKEFDELELRNRTVKEIFSPVEDLGQDKKEDDSTGEAKAKRQKLDTA